MAKVKSLEDSESDEPEGAVGPEDLVVPEPEEETSAEESDLAALALEVREGKWGTGQDRRRRLAEAGHNPKEVEAEVVRQLNK